MNWMVETCSDSCKAMNRLESAGQGGCTTGSRLFLYFFPWNRYTRYPASTCTDEGPRHRHARLRRLSGRMGEAEPCFNSPVQLPAAGE